MKKDGNIFVGEKIRDHCVAKKPSPLIIKTKKQIFISPRELPLSCTIDICIFILLLS